MGISYQSALEKEKDEIERLLSLVDNISYKSVFAYGNPEGKDIDICFVVDHDDKTALYDFLAETEIDINKFDIAIASEKEFYAMLSEHGHKAVEFRAARGADYLKDALKRGNFDIPVVDFSEKKPCRE